MARDAEQFPLKSADGTGLAGYRWRAEPDRATLVLVHGYCDHANRYPELVEAALKRGYSVAALDLRGHGRSSGKPGHIQSMTQYLEDLEALVDEVRHEGKPMFLVAHSMGGLVSIRYLQSGRRGEFQGLVLSSPYLGLALELPAWKRTAALMMTRLWPSFSMPTGIPLSDLSRSAEVVRRTTEDKLYGRTATSRAFTEQLQAHSDAFEQASTLQLPILLLVAGSDRIAQSSAAKRFFELLEADDKRQVVFDAMYHEIFADPDREKIFDILFPWLDQHLSAQA